MVNNILIFWGSGALLVFLIMLCIGVKKYFFSFGVTLSELIQGIFYSIMSWSFFIVCLFAAVIGVLEKMKIQDEVIIKGKKYVSDEY